MHLCANWHNISQNLSQEDLDYLDYDIEESIKTIDWTELGPSLFVYAVTFIVGILGNVLILIAVIRNTQFLKSSPVNVFLGSLASADLLLISICLPLKLGKLFSYTWTMGEFSCKLLYYLQGVSGICSALNLTSLSIERYYVIVHPLKAQYLCTVRKAQKTVALTWIISFILAYPVTLVQIHKEVGFKYCGYWCVRNWDSPLWWQAQEIYFLVVIFVIPTTIMIFAYGRIILEICRVFKERSKMTRDAISAQSKKPNGLTTDRKKSTCVINVNYSEDPEVAAKRSLAKLLSGKNIFRNGKNDQNAIREELLNGVELTEIEKKEMLQRLENNDSNESYQRRNQNGDESTQDLELVPLNSSASLSNTTPDILIDPSKIEEKPRNGSTKKRNLGARLTMTLSKKKSDEEDENKKVKLDEETKQIIKMLISIVLLYVICWAPLLMFNVLHSFAKTIPQKSWWHIPEQLHGDHKHIKTAFSLMAYFNSCLNPLIYGFMSKNFRKSFLFNIRSCCKCHLSSSQQQSTSPTRIASIGYSRKHRNLSVASFVTTNTITHRTQDTNVFTTNKNVIELS